MLPYQEILGQLAPGWLGAEPWQEAGPDPAVMLGEGVLALLRALHGERGCVLVLEDLHWADADTLALLTYLADAVVDVPVVLAMTARDDEAAPRIATLRTHPGVTVTPLARLETAEIAELATARSGGAPLPDPELQALIVRTEGVPLQVEELLGADMSPTLAALVAAYPSKAGRWSRSRPCWVGILTGGCWSTSRVR